MQIIRRIALALLWTLAGVGVLCGVVWGASALGVLKPLIVISGSMEPEIMTGDLLIDVPVDTSTLTAGDVASLPSTVTHDLVTHRIQTIEQQPDGQWQVTMKGDNNAAADSAPYIVGDRSLVPRVQLGGWGTAIQRMTQPAVAIPFIVGLLALLGIVLFFPAPPQAPARPRRGARTRGDGPDAPTASAPDETDAATETTAVAATALQHAPEPAEADAAAPAGEPAPAPASEAPRPLTRRQLSGRDPLPAPSDSTP